MTRIAETFPIASSAFQRLRRNWHLWWAGYHVFAAIDRMQKFGPGGEEAVNALRIAFIYRFPRVRPEEPARSPETGDTP